MSTGFWGSKFAFYLLILKQWDLRGEEATCYLLLTWKSAWKDCHVKNSSAQCSILKLLRTVGEVSRPHSNKEIFLKLTGSPVDVYSEQKMQQFHPSSKWHLLISLFLLNLKEDCRQGHWRESNRDRVDGRPPLRRKRAIGEELFY